MKKSFIYYFIFLIFICCKKEEDAVSPVYPNKPALPAFHLPIVPDSTYIRFEDNIGIHIHSYAGMTKSIVGTAFRLGPSMAFILAK